MAAMSRAVDNGHGTAPGLDMFVVAQCVTVPGRGDRLHAGAWEPGLPAAEAMGIGARRDLSAHQARRRQSF